MQLENFPMFLLNGFSSLYAPLRNLRPPPPAVTFSASLSPSVTEFVGDSQLKCRFGAANKLVVDGAASSADGAVSSMDGATPSSISFPVLSLVLEEGGVDIRQLLIKDGFAVDNTLETPTAPAAAAAAVAAAPIAVEKGKPEGDVGDHATERTSSSSASSARQGQKTQVRFTLTRELRVSR